ncbi:hypothetical protein [Micromonospora endolithica]|uniref:hypothetical protein n=1 Tax=Micromonospora endolithica TaxID=230091 RepID=UPI0011AD3B57|nr:hypothetical protein [Micromonospora endolithica]TWJ26041.1 hypothetical protein JD76_06219 [Micromonospora endolithica]
MISNSEMIRIRRQMQRRIQDVVAERRRARLMEPSASPSDDHTDALATATASHPTAS